MAIAVPVVGTPVSASTFGIPVANTVNTIDTRTTVTAWTGLPFIAPWTNFGSGYQTGQYRKLGDNVQVRGFVSPGTSAPAFSTIATLPAGFRPPLAQQIVILYYNGTSQIPLPFNIDVSGQLNILNAMTGAGQLGLALVLWFSTI